MDTLTTFLLHLNSKYVFLVTKAIYSPLTSCVHIFVVSLVPPHTILQLYMLDRARQVYVAFMDYLMCMWQFEHQEKYKDRLND